MKYEVVKLVLISSLFFIATAKMPALSESFCSDIYKPSEWNEEIKQF